MEGHGEGSNGWRCSIGIDWMRADQRQVFLWKRAPGKRGSYLVRPGADGIDLVFVEEATAGPGPTFTLPVDDLGMLEAIGSAVHAMGLKGLQDERRAELEGELRATKFHLGDVRSLLFGQLPTGTPTPTQES